MEARDKGSRAEGKSALHLLATAVRDWHKPICRINSPQDGGGAQRVAGHEVSAVRGVVFHVFVEYICMAATTGCLATAIMEENLVLATFEHLDMQRCIITMIRTRNGKYNN